MTGIDDIIGRWVRDVEKQALLRSELSDAQQRLDVALSKFKSGS